MTKKLNGLRFVRNYGLLLIALSLTACGGKNNPSESGEVSETKSNEIIESPTESVAPSVTPSEVITPSEEEPSVTPSEEEPSVIPSEEEPSIIPSEEEPSVIPSEEEPISEPVETKNISFLADGNDESYLTPDGGSTIETKNGGWSLNIEDGESYRTCGTGANDHFVYKLSTEGKFTSATLNYVMASNYAVSVSFDGTNYVEIAREDKNVEADACKKTLTNDLSTLEGFDSNIGDIYIKFASTGTYWAGVRVLSVSLDYEADESFVPEEPTNKILSFLADGNDESYLTSDGSSLIEVKNGGWSLNIEDGQSYRTCSNTAGSHFVYKLSTEGKFTSATLNYVMASNYVVSVSFDGTNYNEIAREDKNVEADACVKTLSSGLSAISGFDSNVGDIYVKFESTGTFWAGVRVLSVSLDYEADESFVPETPTIETVTGSANFVANGTDDASYLTNNGGSTIEVKNGGWSLNIEDGQSYRTCGNGTGDFFEYKFDVKSELTKATLSYVMASNYVVSVSFDGNTFVEIAREDKNVEADACVKTLTSDLSTLEGFDSNNGTVYVRIGSTGTFWAGARLLSMDLDYEAVKTDAPDKELEEGAKSFVANGTDDASYLTNNGGSTIEVKNGGWSLNIEDGQSYRTCGNGAGDFFEYKLDIGSKLEEATLNYVMASNYVVSVSFDGNTFVEIAREDKNVEADACVKTLTSDLSALEGFDSNSGVVYVRIGSTGTFWAGARLLSLNLEYLA